MVTALHAIALAAAIVGAIVLVVFFLGPRE
jgi:hypothetical protein